MYLNSRIFRLLCQKSISNAFACTVPRWRRPQYMCTPSLMSKLRLISSVSDEESADKNSRCIFFGGIKPGTTEEMIAGYFSKFGDVEDVRIVKTFQGFCRNYGFIRFKSPRVAEEVLSEKHSIEGKAIDVGRDTKGRVIYVGGLPSHITDNSLKNYFSKFGSVESVDFIQNYKLKSKSGYAFVKFNTIEEAAKAASEESQVIEDSTVNVKLSTYSSKKVQAEVLQSKTMKVEGMPYEMITVEKLRDYFETFGGLKGIDLLFNSLTKTCTGIIAFDGTDGVENALAKENHQIDGHVLNLLRIQETSQTEPREKTLYLGDLAPQTTDKSLIKYFSTYGQVAKAHVLRDHETGISKGCGVVKFRNLESLDSFENISRHVIDGFHVSARRRGLKVRPKFVSDEISGFNLHLSSS